MKTFKTPKGTEIPLLDLRGKDYLQVQWRLVWFREEHPTWSINTEYMQVNEKEAFARATITTDTGRFIATAHKYEDKVGFPDYREKAETGAIGRALALIGYGTQFCADELNEGSRLADSPVEFDVDIPKPAQDRCSCGGSFMVSKYNPNELYCPKCKQKKARA